MPNIPLEDVIRFYKDVLLRQRFLLEPSVIVIIESTIYHLEHSEWGVK